MSLPQKKWTIESPAFGIAGRVLFTAIFFLSGINRLARPKARSKRPIRRSLLAGWIVTLLAMTLSVWLGRDGYDLGWGVGLILPLVWPVVSVVGVMVAAAAFVFTEWRRRHSPARR